MNEPKVEENLLVWQALLSKVVSEPYLRRNLFRTHCKC